MSKEKTVIMLNVPINPTVNNFEYIQSKINLALGNAEVAFTVLDWKIQTHSNMSKFNVLQKSEGKIEEWDKVLEDIEISNGFEFARYVYDFCIKTYKSGC